MTNSIAQKFNVFSLLKFAFPTMVMMVSPAMALSPFPVEAQASGRSSLVRRTVSLRPSWRSSSWAISGVVVMSTTA